MSGILAAIAAADEEYLIALANKGLVKRAQRELENSGVVLTQNGEQLQADFADGVSVQMAGSILDYVCTCPSRSVCKHLLMAVLAAQALPAGAAPAGEPEAVLDFSAIQALTAAQLEKLAGKKQLRRAVEAVQLGKPAVIAAGSTLTVTLPDSGHTVRFLPGAAVGEARCSCRSEGFCSHRLQAVLHFIAAQSGGLPEEFTPPPEESPGEYGSDILAYIRDFAGEVLSTGLARLPEDSPGRFLQLATICHSQRLANMERLCRRLAGQLESFVHQSAAFRPEELLDDLCALLLLCDAVEGGEGGLETVGVFRETYQPLPAIELWGLGAYGWHSSGGYTGVTTVFYSPALARLVTYTAALPDQVSPGAEKMYNGGAPWRLTTRLAGISHIRLGLKGGRLSGKDQLSASASASAQPLGAADIMAPELAPVRYDDYNRLLEALWQQLERGGGAMTAIIFFARSGEGQYDQIKQQWTCPLYDTGGRKLMASVRYEPSTRLLLHNLMAMQEKEMLTGALLARVSLEEGCLTAFPLVHYDQGLAFNLSLDHLPDSPPKDSYYSYFK
jgi:hypothetical protein